MSGVKEERSIRLLLRLDLEFLESTPKTLINSLHETARNFDTPSYWTLTLCLLLTASITGCGTQSIKPIDTIEGNMKTYSEMSDGTWQCDGHIYKYRLEISGRLSNAVKDSTYIYLSNIEDITFEQAWKASGLSSNMDDYFDIDEAVLVELPD